MSSIHPSNKQKQKGAHTRPKLRSKTNRNITDKNRATISTTASATGNNVNANATNTSTTGTAVTLSSSATKKRIIGDNGNHNSSSSPSSLSIDALLEKTRKGMDHALQIGEKRQQQEHQEQKYPTMGLLQGLLKNQMGAGLVTTSSSTVSESSGMVILDKTAPQPSPQHQLPLKSNSNLHKIHEQQHNTKSQKIKGILKHETRYRNQNDGMSTNRDADMNPNRNINRKINSSQTTAPAVTLESKENNGTSISTIPLSGPHPHSQHQDQHQHLQHLHTQSKKVKPTTATMVKDMIVERPFPKADLYPNEQKRHQHEEKKKNNFNSTQIEGYIPKEDNNKQRTMPNNSNDNSNSKSNSKSNSVKIYHHPKETVPPAKNDHDNKNKNNVVDQLNENEMVETEMEFKYMTKGEFESAVQVSAALGMDVNEFLAQQEKIMKSENKEAHSGDNDSSCDGEDKVLRMGKNADSFVEEDNGDSGDDDDYDQEEFFSFFGHDLEDDEEEEEEQQSLNTTPRAFMLLWNALSKWITPKSIIVLQKYRSELFEKDHEEKYSVVVSDNIQQEEESEMSYHSNDIAASRCEGLMSMIKMNLAKSLSDLGYNSTDEYTRQIAHTRLGDFIQSFDFSESMVKFDSKMWFALSVILLDILLPKYDIAYEGKYGVIVKSHDSDDDVDNNETGDDTDESPQKTLPSSLTAIDLNYDEYVYLTQTMIPNLSKGSDR